MKKLLDHAGDIARNSVELAERLFLELRSTDDLPPFDGFKVKGDDLYIVDDSNEFKILDNIKGLSFKQIKQMASDVITGYWYDLSDYYRDSMDCHTEIDY